MSLWRSITKAKLCVQRHFRTQSLPADLRNGHLCSPMGVKVVGPSPACLHARDESCSRQSGRSLFVDSFPSGLWIRLMVHVARGLAGRGYESQRLHKAWECIKHQQKNSPAKLRGACLSLSFRSLGLWVWMTATWTSRRFIVNRVLWSLIQIIQLEHTWINTSSSGGWK